MSDLAVIIPFYQRKPGLLRRSVDSITNQTVRQVPHIIVVDDGSPVDARSELADLLDHGLDGRLTLIRQANAGAAGARNRALEAVPEHVEFVAFLDSDDAWEANHLAKMRASFAAGADFYFTDYFGPDSPSSSFAIAGRERLGGRPLLPEQNLFWLDGEFLDIVIRKSPLAPSTVGYRRRRAPDVRFRTDFRRSCEDRMFFAELSRHLRSVAFSTGCDVKFGWGVNIFGSATWGTPASLRRIYDSMHFHQLIAAEFPLTALRRQWNDEAIAALDHEFVENVLVCLMKGHRVSFRTVRNYISRRPRALAAVPERILSLIRSRRQRMLTAGV